jgi:D-proline reductase (dithiol) PrdB
MTEGGVNFAQVEYDYVRERVYAPFAWHPFEQFSPMNPLRTPLVDARVAFVTTAGVHLAGDEPFRSGDGKGDASWRSVPSSSSFDELTMTHGGFDTDRASHDMNVVLPLDHLRDLERDGRIGSLGPTVYSFMGYVTDTRRLLETEAPLVAAEMLAERIDLVLLAPT